MPTAPRAVRSIRRPWFALILLLTPFLGGARCWPYENPNPPPKTPPAARRTQKIASEGIPWTPMRTEMLCR